MSPNVALRRWRLSVRLTGAALIWSVGLVLAALLVPVYNGQTVSSSQGLTLSTATLIQVNGARALIPVLLPTVVSVVVAVAIRQRHRHGQHRSAILAWLLIGLLTVTTVLAIFSIGAFMLPVVVLLAASMRLGPT